MRLGPDRRTFLTGAAAAALPGMAQAGPAPIELTTPAPAPEWARLQRELLDANAKAADAYFAKYFDDRGYLQVFERWGANDGPDDAAEAVNDWPYLHALGGPDRILELYRKAWEGNLRQYAAARTRKIAYARAGMYHREFPPMIDWQHTSENLSAFNLQGLSDPHDKAFRGRAKRYAGFYTGEDPAAPNYDPGRRLIRSLWNGSRGPLLRPTTPLDWAGEPFDPARFHMEHGERTYAETLAHYAEYTESVGDNPLNLHSTTLALNAYMLDHEAKYRRWLLEYVGAWAERAAANGGVLPSNVGLDGTIGGAAGGRWWGGIYGWGFSPVVPQTGEREHRNRVPRSIVGFMNAYLLTGDDAWLDVWRRQNAAINAHARTVDGRLQTPRMYGKDGWYGWADGPYQLNTLEIWWLSQKPADRAKAPDHPWVAFLEGRNPDYPASALRADLARVAERVERRKADTTTRDTRLADWTLDINPVSVTSLLHLMLGAIHIARPPWSPTSPSQGGAPLYARVRYFDPERRRAGVPPDVAALVETMDAGSVTIRLVNLSPNAARTLVVQGGGYGEHQIVAAVADGRETPVNARSLPVRLAPGAGGPITLKMRRYANAPRLAFPWEA